MPYALGDILTWNVQTAISCELAGFQKVDIYICIDKKYPSNLFQFDVVNSDNYLLFLSELLPAFFTHPFLANLFIFNSRVDLLDIVNFKKTKNNNNIKSILHEYEKAISNNKNSKFLIDYFNSIISNHKKINLFFKNNNRIPLLQSSLSCLPDILGLLRNQFSNKHIVTIHQRLRRLDIGYGGNHTIDRDSNFLEWYNFFKLSLVKFPNVQFFILGRLQEKPLEILRLPNVTSLRTFGMGLGHELTLMLNCDLFIGSSSGFAAMANFSHIPYYLIEMNVNSCAAYDISFGTDRVPFGLDNQKLIYDKISSDLLLKFLEYSFGSIKYPNSTPASTPYHNTSVDVNSWLRERSNCLYPSSTTSRFQIDNIYADNESAYLLLNNIQEALKFIDNGDYNYAIKILNNIESNFPHLSLRMTEFLNAKLILAKKNNDISSLNYYLNLLNNINNELNIFSKINKSIKSIIFKLKFSYLTRLRRILKKIKFLYFK